MAVPLNPWVGAPVVLAAIVVGLCVVQVFRYEFLARRDDPLDRPARHRGVYGYWDFDPRECAWSRANPSLGPWVHGEDTAPLEACDAPTGEWEVPE